MSNMGDGDLVDPDEDGTGGDVSVPQSGAAHAAPVDDHDDHVADNTDDVFDDAPARESEIDDLTDSLSRLDAELADVDVTAANAERDEYKVIAQRIQADFDNFRKRSIAQSSADVERATGRLAEALLPVLDAAESAYLNHPDEVGPLLNQMLTELKKHGLETLDLDGEPFDPEVAEAVHHEPGDGGEPVVAEVLRTGYRWKGRTLRPAMVKTKD